MTQARESQVSLEATSFYHCYVRCVRRAFLCGEDRSTGQNFDHRKQWIASRLKFLSYIYAIDICAYAVMSNHYHVVLHVDKLRAASWSDEEVVERWLQIYKAPLLVEQWQKDASALDKAELAVVSELVATWRERLHDISWFMRGVNETIARMANEEDNMKGRFWEGRFKSQALLDETALLSCMAYVDLNPVRAGIADSLEASDFTSVQSRLFSVARALQRSSKEQAELAERNEQQTQLKKDLKLQDLPEAPLMPFDGSSHTDIHVALPFTLTDYFALVEETGRIIRGDKRGFISGGRPLLIDRLGIRPEKWLDQVKNFSRRYGACAGRVARMQEYASASNKRWCKGVGAARKLVA